MICGAIFIICVSNLRNRRNKFIGGGVGGGGRKQIITSTLA